MDNKFKTPETHPDFKYNKIHYSKSELRNIAFNLIKEGEPYEGAIGDFLLDWVKPGDFLTIQTSGSTGAPKKIRIRKEHMVNSAIATAKFFELSAKSTALLCLPVDYIAGKMMLVRAMVLGWELDSIPPSANPLDQVFKTYDFCAMTPFQLDNSIGRLHLIKKLIVGGGAVAPNLQKMVQGLKTKVYETFGMTETVSHIAAKRLNPKTRKKKEIPFKVLPNVQISKDTRGCLIVNAPKVAEETVITNDVVEILTYKKFLWKGRFDNVINSGGIKLFPEEIERKLNKIIDKRFFVTSLSDDALGQKLVLLIETDFSEEYLQSVKTEIENMKTLDKYEKPKKIYLIEKFEETPTGKIHREHTLTSRIE